MVGGRRDSLRAGDRAERRAHSLAAMKPSGTGTGRGSERRGKGRCPDPGRAPRQGGRWPYGWPYIGPRKPLGMRGNAGVIARAT